MGRVADAVTMQFEYNLEEGARLRVFKDIYGYVEVASWSGTGNQSASTLGQSLVVLSRVTQNSVLRFTATYQSSSTTSVAKSLEFYYGLMFAVLLPLIALCLMQYDLRLFTSRR